MNWKTILHSIVAAAVGGAVTGFATSLATGADLRHSGAAAGAGALVTVAALLKQSPVTVPQ